MANARLMLISANKYKFSPLSKGGFSRCIRALFSWSLKQFPPLFALLMVPVVSPSCGLSLPLVWSLPPSCVVSPSLSHSLSGTHGYMHIPPFVGSLLSLSRGLPLPPSRAESLSLTMPSQTANASGKTSHANRS